MPHPRAGRPAFLLLALATACATGGIRRFPDRAPLLREPETPFWPPPAERADNDSAAHAELQLREAERWMALEEEPRALDVNSLDDVPDSGFFQGRAGARPLGVDEVRHGGETGPGLAPGGAIKVKKAKSAGVTPGFVVEDAAGTKFVLKFDPPGRYGLITGGDAVGARLMWALGYNVPDNRIELIDPARFVADGADPARMAENLALAARAPDGRIRALASRLIDGQVLGPMVWMGVSAGDPNDRVPHEHRRELRALRVFYAWINNPDSKVGNSLDAFVPVGDGREGVVRHYLLDFGTAFGAGGSGPASGGWWMHFAWRTDGLRHEGVDGSAARSGRHDQARVLRREREHAPYLAGVAPEVDPWTFGFLWSNPALARMDRADAAWAVRRLFALGDEQLRAAVASSHWPPAVQEEVVRRLVSRRAAIARAVFARVSSLDAPAVEGGELCARDLELAHGLATAEGRAFVAAGAAVRRDGDRVCAAPPRRDGYHVVELRVVRAAGRRPGPALRVHLVRGGDELRIVGVERE